MSLVKDAIPKDGANTNKESTAAVLRELLTLLRESRTQLREERVRRITESRLLTAMTREEIFAEAEITINAAVALDLKEISGCSPLRTPTRAVGGVTSFLPFRDLLHSWFFESRPRIRATDQGWSCIFNTTMGLPSPR